jgi:hypothetical protein
MVMIIDIESQERFEILGSSKCSIQLGSTTLLTVQANLFQVCGRGR